MSEGSFFANFIQSKFVKKTLWTCAFFIGLLILFIAYIYMFEIPSADSLRNPNIKIASKVYDVKGRYMASYVEENRIPITFKEINPLLITTLIATEDLRFFEHSGIDFRAVMRVFFKSLLMKDQASGGGSTITQQLAKQLYPRPYYKKRNIIIRSFILVKSKIKEWIIALKLENIYSKEAIMTMYLNKFEFINGAHGIEAAALTYFGKKQSQLNLLEVATLVGMLKNPSLYNPMKFAKKTLQRRNEVLDKFATSTKQNIDSLKSKPMDLSKFNRYQYVEGPCPYFRSELAKWVNKTLFEKKILKTDGSPYDVYADGLTINTTIDLDLQKIAEDAANEHMQWIQEMFWKEWKNKNAWTYKADSTQKEFRQSSLIQKIKASNRYKILTTKFDGNDLKEAYNKEFNTAISMQVYDLKKGEKTVMMSPLDSVKYHAMLLQNAFITLDPRNGQVKTYTGGLDYNYFKLDHASIRRSIGSTMKPFLYTLAMTRGVKPCTMYKDQPYTIEALEANFENKEQWAPHNATEIYTTLMYNLYHGLLYSKNSITVKLLKDMGSIEPLRDLLNKVGISKTEKLSTGRLAVPHLPSVCLGAIDVTLLQMVGAYSTFANGGVYREPTFIINIKDKAGKIIYEPKQKTQRAIEPLYNSIMIDMLKNVVGGEFTMHLKSENAGKTGTTNEQSDGWFMGFTPSIVGGVWTGADDKFIHFNNIDIGQGYFTARPVFEKFIKKLEADKTGLYDHTLKFPAPPEGFKELTNCGKIKTEPLPEFLRPKPKLENLGKIDSVESKKVKVDSMSKKENLPVKNK